MQTIKLLVEFGYLGGSLGPCFQQVLDQWDDDSLLTVLRVLGAGLVVRQSKEVAIIEPASRLMDKAARRLSSPEIAAGYEQQLAQLEQSSQQSAQPILSVKELEYVALALQYDILANVSLA